MTLAEMLKTEHPDVTQGARYMPPWLRADKMPQLPPADGLQPTKQETCHLAGWIAHEGAKVVPLIPAAWRDSLACAPFPKGVKNLHFERLAFTLVDHLRGDAVRKLIRDFMEKFNGSPQELDVDLIELFLRLEGPNAVPTLARHFTRKALDQSCRYVWQKADIPKQNGISPEVWDLLWEADVRRELESFHRRGFPLALADLRALAGHPAHGEVLRGLVLAVRRASGDVRAFVLPEEPELAPGECIIIGHASMLDAAERSKWTKRLTAPPPFDQWAFTPKALDISKCAADPLPLFTHLEARGWRRGPAIDGVISTHLKVFPELGLTATLEYTGVPVAFGGAWTRQRLTQCRFEPQESVIAATAVAEDLEGLAA